MTFDDEFTQDATIDLNDWALSGPGNVSNVYLDGANGLAIAADPAQNVRTGICRIAHGSGNFCYSNPPMQVYGYWETSYKRPITAGGLADGFHLDFWFRSASNNGEDDIDEEAPSLSTGNADSATNYVHFQNGEPTYTYPNPSVGDLANDYHTYGLYWANDGSPYGSIQTFFDGQAVTPAFDLSNEWTDGITAKFTIDPCSPSCSSNTSNNNPWYIKYEREWQLVPN